MKQTWDDRMVLAVLVAFFILVVTFCGMAMRNGWFGYQPVVFTNSDAVYTSVSVPTATNSSGFVNINTASAEELEQLPNIGAVIANRIVEFRTKNGPFSSVDALLEVKGIGEKTLEKIRPYVRVTDQ